MSAMVQVAEHYHNGGTPQKLDEGCEIVACQNRRSSDIGRLNDTGNAFYRRRTHRSNAFLIAIPDSGNT